MSPCLNGPSRLLIFCVLLLFVSLSAWGFDPAVVIENRTYVPADGVVFEVAELTLNTGTAVVVDSGAEVTFVAGDSITLGPGFTVKQGGSFTAAIGEMNDVQITGTQQWYGARYIDGTLHVIGGVGNILHLEAGSSITFLSPESALVVDGELVATEAVLTAMQRQPGGWQGIRAAGVVTLVEVTVEYARQGLLLFNNHYGGIHESIFRYNTVGVHVMGPPRALFSTRLSHSLLLENAWYGVKEDFAVNEDTADGQIDTRYNDFQLNTRHYYLDETGAISINRLNGLPENWGNTDGDNPGP